MLRQATTYIPSLFSAETAERFRNVIAARPLVYRVGTVSIGGTLPQNVFRLVKQIVRLGYG
jgi:hypothetical protein